MNVSYAELFQTLLPEAVLLIGALLVIAADLGALRRRDPAVRLQVAVAIAVVSIAVAIGVAVVSAPIATRPDLLFATDELAGLSRLGVLTLALLALTGAVGSRVPLHPAEFVALVLFGSIGLMLMGAVQQLLVAFLAIELASLSLYVLAGFDLSRRASAEAALKYFLFGGMSAAFLLFGFSLLYGLTGSLEFHRIGDALAIQPSSPLLGVALVMVLLALGFKAAAAPFHLWAPDVYAGAPAPAVALIASASKLAGFVLFLRLLWPGLGSVAGDAAVMPGTPGWVPVAAILSAFSLLVGNFVALAQVDVRRLLAYSAIGHAGAILLGVIAADVSGPGPVFYYAATYGLATVGAFVVLGVLEAAGVGSSLTDLAGLHRRSPFLAGSLALFVLSLAGIPPLAGFFGKFAVFASALQLNGISGPVGWLTILAILLSAVALYYYLAILKQAFVAAPASERAAAPIPVPLAVKLSLGLASALLLLLGLFPSLVLEMF